MSVPPNIPFPNLNPPPVGSVPGLQNVISNDKNNPSVQAVCFMPGSYIEQDPCAIPDSPYFCLSMWVYIPSTSFGPNGDKWLPLMTFGPMARPESRAQLWVKKIPEAFDPMFAEGVAIVDTEPNRLSPVDPQIPNNNTGWLYYQGWYWHYEEMYTAGRPDSQSRIMVKGAGSSCELYADIRDITGNNVVLPILEGRVEDTIGLSGGTSAFLPDRWNWVTCSIFNSEGGNSINIPYAQSSFAFPARLTDRDFDSLFGSPIMYAQIQLWTDRILDFNDVNVRQYFVEKQAQLALPVNPLRRRPIKPAAFIQSTQKTGGFDAQGNPIIKTIYDWECPAQLQYGVSSLYFDGTANETDIFNGTQAFVNNRGVYNGVPFVPKTVRTDPNPDVVVRPEIIPFAISPQVYDGSLG